MIKKCLLAAALVAATSSLAMPAGSRITLPSGKKVFLSGMNLAWINFASDVGNTPLSATTIDAMNSAMKAVHDSGGNVMRIWLSTNGTKDPIYNASGLVSGPGTSTVANIKKMLQLGKANNILIMPVLMTHNFVEKSLSATILANNKKLLTTDEGLAAYITNYVTPVVTAIGNDPNLICWEIFNEPEGMVQGWSSPANTVTTAQVQKDVNRIAGAIHKAVPGVLVSNGAASMSAVGGYTDASLTAAGGDALGTLDFYMAHYYGWNGTSESPFVKTCAAWSLDKPLVIGEYASSDWSKATVSSSKITDAGGKVDTCMTYLDRTGYAGGLGWQYQQDAGDAWLKGFVTFGHSMRLAYLADSNSIKLDGTGNGTFSVSVGAGNGGSVSQTPTGRIDSGKSVTLTAVPNPGYTFTGWTGDTVGTAATIKIVSVTKDWNILANFKPGAGTNLLKDGDFTTSSAWEFYAATKNIASVGYTGGNAAVVIGATDDTDYHVQLTQAGVPIDSGVTYVLSFDASATTARSISFGFSGGAPGWKYLGGGQAALTTATKSFTIEILSTGASAGAILQFNLGGTGVAGTITIDNVSLVKSGGTGLARRISAAQSGFRAVPNGFEWIRSSPLTNSVTVRLIDAGGRELFHGSAAAGSVTGFVPSIGAGLRFVVLESAQGREVLSLAGVR